MGIRERKERNRENLRQAILDAAEELFVKEGFENVSMRKIANVIEYSPTTIYLYFKDKNELFYCLLEQYYTKLYDKMKSIDDENNEPLTRIQKGMKVYVEFGLANPNYYKLAFILTPEIQAEDYLNTEFAGTKLLQSLRDNVEQCIRQEVFRSNDVDLATQILWSMNHGITSLILTNPNFPWVDQNTLIDEYIKSAIQGLCR